MPTLALSSYLDGYWNYKMLAPEGSLCSEIQLSPFTFIDQKIGSQDVKATVQGHITSQWKTGKTGAKAWTWRPKFFHALICLPFPFQQTQRLLRRGEMGII